MTKITSIIWLNKTQDHNYRAAMSYLTLLYDKKKAGRCVERLKAATVVEFKAKDIFRASCLSLLGISNRHIESDRKKILSNQALSPLLLLRDSINGKVIIADGYHRMCAVYSYDEDAVIPCHII